MFEKKSIPFFQKKQKVALITRAAGRYGDAAAAFQFKKFLENIGLEVNVVAFDSINDDELEKIFGKGNFMTLPDKSSLLTNKDMRKLVSEADSVFIFPTPVIWDIHLVGLQSMMKENANFRMIAENDFYYTTKPIPFLSQMGLSEANTLGILQSEETLMTNAFSSCAEQLPNDIKNKLFKTNSLESYQKSTDLFLGYLLKIQSDALNITNFNQFIQIAASISQKENIDLLINSPSNTKEFLSDLKIMIIKEKCDVSKIIYIDNQSNEEKVIDINDTGKVLRIANLYPLPHNAMKLLGKMSHPFTLLTGDQSFGKGLLDGHAVFYQTAYWKLLSYVGFLEVIKEACGEKSDYFKFATLISDIEKKDENIGEVIAILKKSNIYEDAKKLAAYLKENKNFFSQENLQKIFVKHSPQKTTQLENSWVLAHEHVDFDPFNLTQIELKSEKNLSPDEIKEKIKDELSVVMTYVNLDSPESHIVLYAGNKDDVLNIELSNCDDLSELFENFCKSIDDKKK